MTELTACPMCDLHTLKAPHGTPKKEPAGKCRAALTYQLKMGLE